MNGNGGFKIGELITLSSVTHVDCSKPIVKVEISMTDEELSKRLATLLEDSGIEVCTEYLNDLHIEQINIGLSPIEDLKIEHLAAKLNRSKDRKRQPNPKMRELERLESIRSHIQSKQSKRKNFKG